MFTHRRSSPRRTGRSIPRPSSRSLPSERTLESPRHWCRTAKCSMSSATSHRSSTRRSSCWSQRPSSRRRSCGFFFVVALPLVSEPVLGGEELSSSELESLASDPYAVDAVESEDSTAVVEVVPSPTGGGSPKHQREQSRQASARIGCRHDRRRASRQRRAVTIRSSACSCSTSRPAPWRRRSSRPSHSRTAVDDQLEHLQREIALVALGVR